MIETVKYKDKNYPLRITYSVLKAVKADIGRDFNNNPDDFDYEGFESLTYHALRKGCKAAGREFDMKKEEIEDFLDECMSQVIDMLAAFSRDQLKMTGGQAVKK